MDDVLKFIGISVAFLALMVVVVPLATLFGALGGWSVGLFWGDAILITLRKTVGLDPQVTMWQLGAALGFVGSFLRTSVSTRRD